MRIRRTVGAAIVGLVLATGGFGIPAALAARHKHHAYVLKHPKRHDCRKGYVKRHRTVKRRKHGRVVHQHRVVCVQHHRRPKHHPKRKRPAKTIAPASSTPSVATPAPTPSVVRLHAHLDPSFTRDASNPFRVTYSYSASATSEPAGTKATLATSEPVPLPEGVLQLYNDGLLACSKNVGGATTGGECPVTYSTLGEHTVTTVYTSGETAATETSVEHIEAVAVSVSAAASYTAFAHSEAEGVGECHWESTWDANCAYWQIGSLTLEASASDAYGMAPGVPHVSMGAPSCSEAPGVRICGTTTAGAAPLGVPVWAATPPGEPQRVVMVAFGSGRPESLAEWQPAADAEAGYPVSASDSPGAGYAVTAVGSSISFTPAVVE